MTRRRSSYRTGSVLSSNQEILHRPIQRLEGSLSPEEAASRCAATFWPHPRRLLSVHATRTEGVWVFRMEKLGCWYSLQKGTFRGRAVWEVRVCLTARWGETY